MTTFWILAILLSLIAASFIFVPMMLSAKKQQTADLDRKEINVSIYRERLQELDSGRESGELGDDEYAAFKAELEQTLLMDVEELETTARLEDSRSSQLIPIVAACAIPLLAILLYADWGVSMGRIADVELAQQLQQPVNAPHEQRNMEDALTNLETSLLKQPDNHDGWFLLGSSMLARGNYDKAVDAFAHLLNSFPEDTSLLSRQAQAMYLADGRRLTARVQKIIDKTMSINPHEPNVLEILGMDAFDRGEYPVAIDYFNKMLRQELGPRMAQSIREMIAQATARLPDGAVQAPVEQVGSTSVNVLIELDEKIEVAKEKVVFVFARAVDGPPMPLAAQRLTVADLPTMVRLDDSMSMNPDFTLSTVKQVQIVARIALSGGVTASAGDWQAVSAPLNPESRKTVVKLRISEAVQ